MRKVVINFWWFFRTSILGKSLRKIFPQKLVNFFFHLPIALLANLIYGFPSRKIKVIGVSGTDGKTTTVYMIYEILKAAGKKVSMVSTINAFIAGENINTGYHVTSPDPFIIQKILKQSIDNDDEYAVLEVTSHALDQYRFLGIKFNVGIITNITHEHLDYHKDMQRYIQAKSKLIRNSEIAILNHDDSNFEKLKRLSKAKVISFGSTKSADFNQNKFPLKLKVPGDYNIQNAQAAAAACIILGINSKIVKDALLKFKAPEGRMQEVPNNKGLKIVVDFAHTPNGLEQALKTLKKECSGKLIAVIGAEGYRDQLKRPMMGKVATTIADLVVVTAVDPRGLINQINQQILQGAKLKGAIVGRNIFLENNRGKAISMAINKLAKSGDTIGIFGKGHEKSMNLNGKEEVGWSDLEAVDKALND